MSEGGGALIHATCVAIDGRGLLLSVPSCSGKSDLALRLIDRGARLVSDDYTRLEARGDVLMACPAPRIEGRIEVRGVGIEEVEPAGETPVALLLQLDETPERLPDVDAHMMTIEGITIPALPFAPFELSAPIKAEAALRRYGIGAPR